MGNRAHADERDEALVRLHRGNRARRLACWPPRETGIIEDLVEGFRYVWGFRPIRALLLLMALTSLAGVPTLIVLMPIFADAPTGSGSGGGDEGARVKGLLTGASGLGAVCGAIYLASRHSVFGLGRMIITAAIAYTAALFCFALVDRLWLALLGELRVRLTRCFKRCPTNDKRGRLNPRGRHRHAGRPRKCRRSSYHPRA